MKVLVYGGRNYNDWQTLFGELHKIHKVTPITEIISGKARGADYLGGSWTVANSIKLTEYLANWDRDGKAAGPIRNQQMLDEGKPDLVIAFPGGAGTKDMITRSKAQGFKVLEQIL